ncbi:hypothetical protein Trichorick_01379 (plasmid) [Candidatus Trichorickettsia mobilis]|uniref:Lipoprotein n=1 Tax=Candidatus Trichorickettsia mobilis TaxID=1346319 RepID=A0ABZ0UVD1_9RICK|nr:hypothetical protein Trichorick_01379 [Candidatus Trichorickettsia mobilis]
MLLSSCSKTSSNFTHKIHLPEMPIAGKEVANELTTVCDKDKCKNIYLWLTKLHDFKIEYNIYKEELAK